MTEKITALIEIAPVSRSYEILPNSGNIVPRSLSWISTIKLDTDPDTARTLFAKALVAATGDYGFDDILMLSADLTADRYCFVTVDISAIQIGDPLTVEIAL